MSGGNDIFLFAARIFMDFQNCLCKVLSLVVISSMLALFKSSNVHDVCISLMPTQNLSLLGSTTQSVLRLVFIVRNEYSLYIVYNIQSTNNSRGNMDAKKKETTCIRNAFSVCHAPLSGDEIT